jgi:hypothetical protein
MDTTPTSPDRPPSHYRGRHRPVRPCTVLARRIRDYERLRLRATQLAVGVLVATITVAWLLTGTSHPHQPTVRHDASVPEGLPGVATRVGVHRDGPLRCGDYHIAVTPRPSTRHGLTVYGQLCAAGRFDTDRVELDLPDAGYDHHLFAWPAAGLDYTRAATGRVMFAIDPLGAGASDHPDGAALTVDTQAWVAHQLIAYLHTGMLGARYRKVIEIGSGTGAQIATTEASRWHDAAALIALDAGHTRALPTAHLVAAATDARLRGQPWAGRGYLSIPAGSRCAAGYYSPGAPVGVCALDEKLEGSQPVPDGLRAAPADFSWGATGVTAPVLLVLDDRDPDTCPTVPCTPGSPAARRLAAAFRAAPRRDLWIQPDAGRLGLLHRTATLTVGLINRWLRQQTLLPLDTPTTGSADGASRTDPTVWFNGPDTGRDLSRDGVARRRA